MNDLSVINPAVSRASRVQKVVASCGIVAWLVEDYAVPIVAVEMSFRGGSVQDPIGKAGAARMLAGMLDEGAGELDAEAFQNALDDKAIELSFSADRDAHSSNMRTLAVHTDAAFDMLRLALNAPRFDDKAIERVRAQMLAGLKFEANDPGSMASKAFRKAGFAGHPYGLPTRGDLVSVAEIARADLVHLHDSIFARDTLKIAVVGAIDAERLSRLLDATFAQLPAKAKLHQAPLTQLQAIGSRHIIDADLSQSTLQFGRVGIGRHDDDFTAAVVVNHIFGGGSFTSRLFREVREKRGLAYSINSQLANYDLAFVLAGSTSTKNERAREALDVIQEQIRLLAEAGPGIDELTKAQKFLIGSYALRFDTSTKIARQLVQLQVDGFDADQLDRRNHLIAAVTLDEAKRVAARLLGDGDLLVAIAGRPTGM